MSRAATRQPRPRPDPGAGTRRPPDRYAADAILAFGREMMGKGLILWLLGVPGIVVIALLLFRII